MDKRLPPTWLLGLANLPVGVSGALALMAVPQLLSAEHVPEPRIAAITGLALVPGFCGFLLAPILDVRLSRRTYALIALALCMVLGLASVLALRDLPLLGPLLFALIFAVAMYSASIAGWFGSLVAPDQEARLGAWFVVGNVGGFGVASLFITTLVRAQGPLLGGLGVSLMLLLPLLILPFVPAPGADRRLARESFGQLARDLAGLVRQSVVLRTLFLFSVPAASFALTNTLGGLGRDYGASERLVSLIAGIGVTGAGLLGCLIVPSLAERLPARGLYLAIGAAGAVFTLTMLLTPRTPAVFAVILVGQNVFQAAALATGNVIAFRGIGENSLFAATQFALYNAAMGLPISYMQVLDGHTYGAGGLRGMYLTDGGLGLLACAVLGGLFLHWSRRDRAGRLAAPMAA